MKISIQHVEHMAKLSRLELSEEEKVLRAKEFSEILDYVETLHEVDTQGITPMVGATTSINSVRDDKVTREQGEQVRRLFVTLAPEHTDEFIETISPFSH